MTEQHSPAALSPFADQAQSYPALDGCAPASLGRRAAARLLDGVFGTALGLVCSLPMLTAKSVSALATMTLLMYAVSGVACVVVYLYFGRTGFLPGGRMLGVRQVRVTDGSAPGWAGLGKYLLVSVVSGLTLGLGYLVTIALIRRPLNRGWHDRAVGLVVLDIRAGRDPMSKTVTGSGDRPEATERPAAVAGSPAVIAVGGFAPASDQRAASNVAERAAVENDFTQLAPSALGAQPVRPAPAAPPSSVAPPVVPIVGDGDMIVGVPWRSGHGSGDTHASVPAGAAGPAGRGGGAGGGGGR